MGDENLSSELGLKPGSVGLGRGLMKGSSTFRTARRGSGIVTEDSRFNISSLHSYHEEEKEGLVDYVNGLLRMYNRPPINTKSNDIFEIIKDGILLCIVVNAIQPGALDETRVNFKEKLSIFEKGENLMLALQAAQDALNISLVNIGVEDLLEGRPMLVLSVLWQLVNVDLRTRVRVHSREIGYLLSDEEEPDGAGRTEPVSPPDLPEEFKILLRWINHHLAAAGSDRRVHNFASDLKDSVAFILLLNQLAPEQCTRDALKEPNLPVRAALMLQSAERVGCKKFLNPDDILQGNSRLNFAFLAYLFTKFNQPKTPRLQSTQNRLDEQAIELADIHKESQQIRSSLNKAQELTKESLVKLATIKDESRKVESVLENRISDIENQRKLQTDLYASKIERLKQDVADAKSSQLPSVPELKAAIAAEKSEQEVILQEAEKNLEKIEELRVDVTARVAVRKREENLLDRVNNEIKTIETEHAAKAKSLTDKIDSLGLPALQQRLNQAISQTEELSAKNVVLVKNRDTLVAKIGEEKGARSKASAAKLRIEAELEKARKNLEETSGAKLNTVVYTTGLEKRIVKDKEEVVKVKKDVIRLEYQIDNVIEDTEEVQSQTSKIQRETEMLVIKEEDLIEEVTQTKKVLDKEMEKTEVEVKAIKVQNEKILLENDIKYTAEIREYATVSEKLAGNLQDVVKTYTDKQVEVSLKNTFVDVRSEEVRGLKREILALQQEHTDLERAKYNLARAKNRTNEILEKEVSENLEIDSEIQALEAEKQAAFEKLNEKLAKREVLETEIRLKQYEASKLAQDTQIFDHPTAVLPANQIDDLTPETLEKKQAKLLLEEERKRTNLVREKEHAHIVALNKEKEMYLKKMQELNDAGVKRGIDINTDSLSELEKEVAKLKAERENLSTKEQRAAAQLKIMQEEKDKTRVENKKLLQAHTQLSNTLEKTKTAVDSESKLM